MIISLFIIAFQIVQVTKEFFEPGVNSETLFKEGLQGERVSRARLNVCDGYRIFVQSKGFGARHLAAGTVLLYDHEEKVTIHTIYM